MKHEFKEGDGMSKKTSTPEERKEIFELLHNEEYNVNLLSGTRAEGSLKRGLLFYRDEFVLSYYDGITNDYTYQEMKDLILGKDNSMKILTIYHLGEITKEQREIYAETIKEVYSDYKIMLVKANNQLEGIQYPYFQFETIE